MECENPFVPLINGGNAINANKTLVRFRYRIKDKILVADSKCGVMRMGKKTPAVAYSCGAYV